MYRELHEPITRICGYLLHKRANSIEVIEWIKENPEQFEELLLAFDTIITNFNAYTDPLPDYYKNFHNLKRKLNSQSLPTISSIIDKKNVLTLFQLKTTIAKINEMMINGEAPLQIEPYLAYHTAKTNDYESLAAGSIFHFYEAYVLLHELPVTVEDIILEEDIEGALIEILSFTQANPLWSAVADADRLNWVKGWDGFSGPFIESCGLI